MTDPFKYPESTAYASQQNFAFIPNFLKGTSVARPSQVSSMDQFGTSSGFGVQSKENIKKGFSTGYSLDQPPLFPSPRPNTAPSPARRSAPKKEPRKYPTNNSDYHYNKTTKERTSKISD